MLSKDHSSIHLPILSPDPPGAYRKRAWGFRLLLRDQSSAVSLCASAPAPCNASPSKLSAYYVQPRSSLPQRGRGSVIMSAFACFSESKIHPSLNDEIWVGSLFSTAIEARNLNSRSPSIPI